MAAGTPARRSCLPATRPAAARLARRLHLGRGPPARAGNNMRAKRSTRRPKVRLAPAHRLLLPAGGAGLVLVTRAGRVRLNATAAAVLALCDGTLTPGEIITRIAGSAADPA